MGVTSDKNIDKLDLKQHKKEETPTVILRHLVKQCVCFFAFCFLFSEHLVVIYYCFFH